MLTPAQYIINQFGGLRAAARALGCSSSSVYRWQHYKNRHGEVGRIPSSMQNIILEKAHEMGLDITPEHLVHGGPAKAA